MNPDENNPNKYLCSICDFKSNKESNYSKHLLTSKHKNLLFIDKKKADDAKKIHECKCGKKYKHLSTLCAHRKNCSPINNASCKQVNIISFINQPHFFLFLG